MSNTPEMNFDSVDGSDIPARKINPWLKRTLGREAFYLRAKPYVLAREAEDKGEPQQKLVKGGPHRCFVARRLTPGDFYGGLRFWLVTGQGQDGRPYQAPFYSAAHLRDWSYIDRRNGKRKVGLLRPPLTCPISDIVKNHPDRIANVTFTPKGSNQPQVQTWPDGTPKKKYEEVFALEVYEVCFEYRTDAHGKDSIVVDPTTKKPKYTINPVPYIFEMRRPWWDQFKDKILAPKPVTEETVADPDNPEPSEKKVAVLPAVPLNHVMFKLRARLKDDKQIDDEKNVAYDVAFSETLTIDPATWQPKDELPSKADGTVDWSQIYPPVTPDDIKGILDGSFNHEEDEPGAPVPADEAGGDDIPF